MSEPHCNVAGVKVRCLYAIKPMGNHAVGLVLLGCVIAISPGTGCCSKTIDPSPIQPTPSPCFGAAAPSSPPQTTASFKPTRWNEFETSLLDSERPEVCFFAS
jgi:hypothetical protein